MAVEALTPPPPITGTSCFTAAADDVTVGYDISTFINIKATTDLTIRSLEIKGIQGFLTFEILQNFVLLNASRVRGATVLCRGTFQAPSGTPSKIPRQRDSRRLPQCSRVHDRVPSGTCVVVQQSAHSRHACPQWRGVLTQLLRAWYAFPNLVSLK